MAAEIRSSPKEIENGWEFEVEIEENGSKTNHKVTVNRDFYQKITQGKIPPETLVKKSFEFLLEREPAESILSEFNLEQISAYFPEYEGEITSKLF